MFIRHYRTGYSRIAKLVNAERAPAPPPKRGRPIGWSPSTVKVILDRRRCVGEVIWNRREKRDVWGHRVPRMRPEAEWVRTSVPALRLVSDEQWHAAHARLARNGQQARTLPSAIEEPGPTTSAALPFGAQLAGTVGLPTNVVPVRGFEPRSRG